MDTGTVVQIVNANPGIMTTWGAYILPGMFIGFGLIVIILQIFVSRKFATHDPPETTRLSVITLIIVISTALITSNISSDKYAPLLGLFGTIAGYLMGHGPIRRSPNHDEKSEND